MAVSALSICSALVWGIAGRLHRTAVQRQKAEAELRQVSAQLEEQVKARTAALAASEARYRRLVEESAEGIIIHQAGVMRLLNAAAARLLGYDHPVEAVGQPVASHIAPEHREGVLTRIEARLRGTAVPLTSEMEGLRRDGRRVWIEATAAVVAGVRDPTPHASTP